MFQLFFTLCFLAVSSSAAPADVKKTVPVVPNAFTMTVVATEPDNTVNGETIVKYWYDGEEGKLRKELEGKNDNGESVKIVEYSFNNFEGKPADFYIDKVGQCHRLNDEGILSDELANNPLELPLDAKFLEECDVNGDKVEKWQFGIEGLEEIVVYGYYRVKEGTAIPVLFERYTAEGSDLILASVIEVKEFTASKPDEAAFQLDAKIRYILTKYEGRGAVVDLDSTKPNKCSIKLGQTPLSSYQLETPANPTFLGTANVNGEEVEQWKFFRGNVSNEEYAIIYVKRQDGFGVPVKMDLYAKIGGRKTPTLAIVANYLVFTIGKPPASTFDIDPKKCTVTSKRRVFTKLLSSMKLK